MARLRAFRPLVRFLVLASFAFFLTSLGQCQILNVGDDTSTPIPGAGHDYIKMLSETVNPANGSVSIRIQTPTPPGRGISLPFSFAYDSNGAQHLTSTGTGLSEWWDNSGYLSQGGWSYSMPMLSNVRGTASIGGQPPRECFYWMDYMFQDATGGRHSLGVSFVYGTGTNPCAGAESSPSQKLNGGDDYYKAALGNASYLPAKIADAAGTVYTFSASGELVHEVGNNANLTSALPTSIEDRNGNQILVTDNGSGSFTATDSVGRALLSSSGFGTGVNTVTVSGLQLPYTITWGTASPNFSLASWLVFNNEGDCYSSLAPDQGTTINVIKSIELPNGQSYQFSYDSTYGMLSQITYPTGGYVKYTWGVNGRSESASFEDTKGEANDCWYQHDSPAVTGRTVSFDGVHTALTQIFSYSPTVWSSGSVDWNTKSTKVTTTDNITGAVSVTQYAYTPILPTPQPNDSRLFAAQIPLEQTTTYENSAGTAVHTVTKAWYDQYELKSQQTLLNDSSNNLTNETTYAYGSGAQVTDKQEFDYGSGAPGALLRETATNYQAFADTPLYTAGPSIFDRPCQSIVYDGSKVRYAETDYYYDNGSTGTVCGTAGTPSVTGVSGLTGHDETNYGPSSTTPRGNVTQKTQWANTGSSPVTTYTYDETGQVLSSTDPCGNGTCSDMTGSTHTTTYSYSNSYTVLSGGSNSPYTPSGTTNAYLTKVTDPLGHSASFTYDYNGGQLTESTDANSQSTFYIYNDPFARPTQFNYPDGGQTENVYNDSPTTPSVTTCQLINGTAGATCISTSPATGWKTSLAVMDGLGHVVQTQLPSDPDGNTYTATKYDGFHRPYQVTNPYRTTGDSTYGVTTQLYDAIGRSCLVVPPDFAGSAPTSCPTTAPLGSTFTSYSGNLTTVTDEAGNQRKSQTDGLGRLTSVTEAPNATGYAYLTNYVYNPRNDLKGVTQNGSNSSNARIRSFVYDSLSRLTSAINPESGTITYSYDANGNLQTRTAPAPNQTGTGTVTTTYAYDVLNRMKKKSYSDGTTPTVQFGYDAVALTGCSTAPPPDTDSYPVARRTAMCDGAGASSWTHDKMGRTLQDRRTTGSVTGDYETDAYNFDGSPVDTSSLGYVIDYTYSGAQRPLTAISYNTNPRTNFVTGATYAPPGELAAMTMGSTSSFAGIVTNNAYSGRLQPILLSAAVSGQSPAFSLCFDFHLGVAVTAPSPCSFSASTLGDNGNVYQMVNNRNSTRNESFTYDSLNRIASGQSSGTQWGEAYTTDAWGNMTAIGSYNSKPHESLSTSAGINNQLVGFGYDAAGNMTSNGSVSYVYDAENRLISTNANGSYSYLYDGDGQRVEKCTPEGATPGTCASGATGTLYWRGNFVSDALTETDLSGNVQNNYVFFNGQRVARVDSAGAVHYYFSDHLGSHGVVENATGSACEQDIDYYSYGGVEDDYCPNVAQNYKFTSKERDSESNLDNFGARYLASTMGRFMTPDWAAEPVAVPYAVLPDPQTLNLYGYVRNNPFSKHDPDGHVVGVDDATILLVGGGILFTAAVIHYYSQNPDANPGVALGAAARSTVQAFHNFFSSDNSKTVPNPQSNPAPGTQTGVTAAPAVPLPSGLVGTQDDKSGQSGGRIVNGPLDPAHGGVGDAGKDFDTLTGGKSGPPSTGSTLPAGSRVGDNGIVLRPGQDGPRIDIPANGDKPRETLHYPQQQDQEQDQDQEQQ